jgi:AcrR family transcriptional regulator
MSHKWWGPRPDVPNTVDVPTLEDPRVERTREVVLNHVRDLVRAEGMHAVTPQRVASDTRISRSTLHRHWPDTRALLLEAMAEPLPAADTPVLGDLRLDLGVDLHQLRLHLNDRQTLSVYVSLLGESVFDEGFASLLRAHTIAHLDRLRRVLAAGQEAGALRAGVDVEDAAATLAGPFFFRRLVLGEEITPEYVDAVIDGFVAAFAP